MSPESDTTQSHKGAPRHEKEEWKKLEDQLGKERVKSIKTTLSKIANGNVIVFPATETRLNIPPSPDRSES
jgi:succinate dehydrogenase/fumarate reductase flavoprotein subunit